jgi:hypothetical protein
MPAKADIALRPSRLRQRLTRHANSARSRRSALARDAFALVAFKGKSGRSPSATQSLFSCVAKRKVTKREGHPAWRLPGTLPGKSVSRGRAFRQDILPWRKGVDIPVDSRYAAYRPRLTAAQGPRVEQRAIVARTLCSTAARLQEQKNSKKAARRTSVDTLGCCSENSYLRTATKSDSTATRSLPQTH